MAERKEIIELLRIRDVARKNKDFKVADMIREYIAYWYKLKVHDTEWGCTLTRSQ